MPRRFLQRVAPLWILCVIIASFLPGKDKAAIGTYTPFLEASSGNVRWQHRAAHFVTFGTTALLLILLARSKGERLAACAAVMVLGLAIETGQFLFFQVGMEWYDVRDDALASLAVLAFGSLQRVRVVLVRP